MRYLPEPKQEHSAIAKTAVLLVNLGTPDAPTPQAVRRYLKQFLSDPRVMEIPRALWLPILHGFVLNTRPRKSARKYASIWSSEGSPLKVHTERQARLLRGYSRSRALGPVGTAGHAGHELPRLATLHACPRGSLPFRVPCDRAPAGPGTRACREPLGNRLPVPFWAGGMDRALYRIHPRRLWPAGRAPLGRDLSRFRCGLPRDARRNRHRGPRDLPRRGRRGISPVAVSQRACRLDSCLGRNCAAASRRLGNRIPKSWARTEPRRRQPKPGRQLLKSPLRAPVRVVSENGHVCVP